MLLGAGYTAEEQNQGQAEYGHIWTYFLTSGLAFAFPAKGLTTPNGKNRTLVRREIDKE